MYNVNTFTDLRDGFRQLEQDKKDRVIRMNRLERYQRLLMSSQHWIF